MVTSKATTVKAYLAGIDPERRAHLEKVRRVILDHLDPTYEEGIQYGMIGYYVPHQVFPAGYHCDPKQPLPFGALAAQKNHLALYLMVLYVGTCEGPGQESPLVAWFHKEWRKTGKKMDMGKSCIRFKRADDLPLDLIGRLIARVPARKYISGCVKALGALGKGRKSARS